MLVEDMRGTHLGEIALWYKNVEIDMPSHFYLESAFHSSLEALSLFENPYNSESIRFHRRSNYDSVIFWFLCLESYITSFAKLISLKDSTIIFNALKGKDVCGRLNAVLKGYELEKYRLEYKGLQPQINEFCTFRNELFHDRFFQTEQRYDKTVFSKIATDLNIIDVLQAMDIAINMFTLLSRIICDLDLMPQIVINGYWVRIDILYGKIIDLFKNIVRKHNCSTNLILGIKMKPFDSSVFLPKEVLPIIRAKNDNSFVLEKSLTNRAANFFVEFPILPNNKPFVTPNYYRGHKK